MLGFVMTKFHLLSLNIMLFICRILYATFILACRGIPLPPTCLLLGAVKMEKNPKTFLVARLLTRMRTILKSFLYIPQRYNLQPSFKCFRGYMRLRVG